MPKRGIAAAAAAAAGETPAVAAATKAPPKSRKSKATAATGKAAATAVTEDVPAAAPARGGKRKKKEASDSKAEHAAAVAAADNGVAAGARGEPEGAEAAPAKKPRARKPKQEPKAEQAGEGEAAAEPSKEESGSESAGEGKPAKKPRQRKPKAPPGPLYTEALRPPPPDQPCTKLLSWNVAGLRGVLKKHPHCLAQLLEREKPDVLCLQEIKISDHHVEEITHKLGLPDGWHVHCACSKDKAGYSGVATLSRVKPLSVQHGMEIPDHDGEGRLLITEFQHFYLVNTYVPNSGEGLRRLDYRVKDGGWDHSLANLVKKLEQRKPVVLTGDLNCAHQEIDIHNPKTNLRSAGFTQEERDSFGARYLAPPDAGGCGLIDTFRNQYPGHVGYTYYSYRFNCRAKGIGWRLDYFLVSGSLGAKVHDSFIMPDFEGSDHVPLGITVAGLTVE